MKSSTIKFSKNRPDKEGAYLVFSPEKNSKYLPKEICKEMVFLTFVALNKLSNTLCFYHSNGAIVNVTDDAFRHNKWMYLGYSTIATHDIMMMHINQIRKEYKEYNESIQS
jgi:threonyl-tRNA synthetase